MRNKKIKIIVDTNIFLNCMIYPEKHIEDSLLFAKLLTLINLNKIELVFSQDTIGELMYVSKNHIKYNISKESQLEYMNAIAEIFFYSYSVNTDKVIAPKCNDKYDNMFLECIIVSHAKYLITNDFKSGMNKVENINCTVLSSKQFNNLFSTADEFVAMTKEE